MAQKRRNPATQEGLDRITLMIPAALRASLEAEIEPGVRTLSDVVRDRLRRGSDTNNSDAALSPWAIAVGRAISLLANEVDDLGRPRGVAMGMVKVGAQALLSDLGASELSSADGQMADLFARILGLKIRQVMHGEGPSINVLGDMIDGSLQHRQRNGELLKIQRELLSKE